MNVHGQDISDCFDCPMLAGLTEEQKLQRIRTDPIIARCLAKRKSVVGAQGAAKRKRVARAPEFCSAETD